MERKRVLDLLACLSGKGARIWLENRQLRFQAPKGALIQHDIELLHEARSEIVRLLDSVGTDERTSHMRIPESGPSTSASLSFLQLAHWNDHKLDRRASARNVAHAVRVRGRLDVEELRRSASQMVLRHHALRTRIVVYGGVPRQEVVESPDLIFESTDLTEGSKGEYDLEVRRALNELLLRPVQLARDPPCVFRLMRVDDEEHVLVIAMDHIVADGVSQNILWRELFSAYQQGVTGRRRGLPTIPVQFIDYARWQRASYGSWLEQHGQYWEDRLTGCERLRLSRCETSVDHGSGGWGAVQIALDAALTAELRGWCKRRCTTLPMAVFSAYVAFVLRWCGVSEGCFQFQIDGRGSRQIQNTVGLFTCKLSLRVQMLENDTFDSLLASIVQEYCDAYTHADYGYWAAQVPKPEFTCTTTFNWVPRGSLQIDVSELRQSERALVCAPMQFVPSTIELFDLDAEPEISICERDEEIAGEIYFPRSSFSVPTMEQFARGFAAFVPTLIRNPCTSLNQVLFVD